MLKGTFAEPLLWWAYAAFAVTAALLGVYAASQQVYRQSLDDPQIQMVEDAALALSRGGVPADVVPHSQPVFDMTKSLAPWIAVYDGSGLLLESSATLDGLPPKLPQGLFDVSAWSPAKMYVQNDMRETRVTWQPQDGVRQAVVLVQVNGNYYVAAGRNMREVEQRIEHLGEMLFAGWLLTLAALLAASYIGWYLLKK